VQGKNLNPEWKNMLDQKNNRRSQNHKRDLPPIPDKLYFTIGEVSKLCSLRPHVLRYWEQEFSQLNPDKRRGNRRYYRRKDVLLVREIMSLLYEQGFTIEGARVKLSNERSQDTFHQISYHFIKEIITNLESVLSELES
jgi:DNA-binding transcriptional MerR regulator